jgi:hypothetical protein
MENPVQASVSSLTVRVDLITTTMGCDGVKITRSGTESQIVAILAEGDAGLPVGEVCRKHSISNALYCQWKSK